MLNYTSYINSIVNLMPVPSAGDPGFQIMVGNMIDDAELRLYRELDLLNASVRDFSATFTTGTRIFSLPTTTGTFLITDYLNVITPSSVTDPDLGLRNPLTPASEHMLNTLWPSATGSTIPQYYAMFDQDTVIVGPWPDAAYTVEVCGMQRPASLSTTNVTTQLSVFFPDLFVAASMVFASGYMKNFGASVDDPKSGVTWEAHLQTLMRGAQVEEMRKRYTGPGWSSDPPAPLVAPPSRS